MKNFLSLGDVSDLTGLIRQAIDYQDNPLSNRRLGVGKTLGLIFMNPSLRTRLSTQRAAYNLGMDVMVVNVNQDSWNLEFEEQAVMSGTSVEHVKDAAQVVSQYCNILGIRSFAGLDNREKDYQEKVLKGFVNHVSIPVISLESATLHPLQSLADLITIEQEKTVERPRVVLSWAPHPKPLPQAVANSFLQWMAGMEYELVVTHPQGYELKSEFTEGAAVIKHQDQAFRGAHFIYAKNWSSYHHYGQVVSTDNSWTIDEQKMALTAQAKFMHCLPVRRNVVATDAVIDHSLVIDQARNRLFAAQAVLTQILEAL